MIVCDRYQFIYVGPPKTASTSLHHWLSQPGLCPVRWTPEGQDQHTTVIPPGKDHYQILVSIRHPMERLVSLWKQFTSPSSVSKVPGCYACSLSQFVVAQPGLSDFFRLGQADYVARLPRVDHWLRVTRLTEDLAGFPWRRAATEPIPRRNRTRHGEWRELLTAEEQAAIRRRWAGDWELGIEWS